MAKSFPNLMNDMGMYKCNMVNKIQVGKVQRDPHETHCNQTVKRQRENLQRSKRKTTYYIKDFHQISQQNICRPEGSGIIYLKHWKGKKNLSTEIHILKKYKNELSLVE